MIDKFQRIALAIHILRLPSIAVGLTCLISVMLIVLTSESHEGDRFLLPGFVGILWAISTYSFIVTFSSVPEKADLTLTSYSKLKRNIVRGWYWFIGAGFLGTTLALIYVTNRLVSIWLRDYGG